jgi:hypothetical protein
MAEMVVREIEKDSLIEAQRARSEALKKENNQLIRALDCFRCAARAKPPTRAHTATQLASRWAGE